MNNKRTSALCPLPSALCPLPDRQIVDANMLMLNAPCSMLNVQFFLTYAHTHTHMHFKKAPPSNRSFPRGPCGRCKGEDEVEAKAGEKRRSIGDGRLDVRGSSTSNIEHCNPRPVHGRVPTARVPPRERERGGCRAAAQPLGRQRGENGADAALAAPRLASGMSTCSRRRASTGGDRGEYVSTRT